MKSRLVGWLMVGVGAACVLVGVSPLFAVRFEAYILGVALFFSGAWVLAGKELRETIRKGVRTARESRQSSQRLGRRPWQRDPSGIALLDRLLPVRILKLARQENGILTVAQVAMELNVPLDQAQAGLDECVRAGNALPDYDVGRGHALYKFPEFSGPDHDLLSN